MGKGNVSLKGWQLQARERPRKVIEGLAEEDEGSASEVCNWTLLGEVDDTDK